MHLRTTWANCMVARSAPTVARPNEKFCYRTIIRTTSRAIDCNRSQTSIAACERHSVSHQTFTIGCMYLKSTEIARAKIVRSGVTKDLHRRYQVLHWTKSYIGDTKAYVGDSESYVVDTKSYSVDTKSFVGDACILNPTKTDTKSYV